MVRNLALSAVRTPAQSHIPPAGHAVAGSLLTGGSQAKCDRLAPAACLLSSSQVVLTEQIVRGKTRIDRLDEVRNLNLWGQDIDDVSVLARLPGVEVLSLSVNRCVRVSGGPRACC